MNDIELQSLIVLVWSSEWSFSFKKKVAEQLMKEWEEIQANDE